MNHDHSEESVRLKLPSVRVGIGTLFTIVVAGATLCGTIFWVFSDKHNADVFLTRSEYQKDQQYITATVKDIKTSQDEMRTDIKQILKEQKK